MRAVVGMPAEGTFRHALIRFDWNGEWAYNQAGYGEIKDTVNVPYEEGFPLPPFRPNMEQFRPEKPGDPMCMVFVGDSHFRTYLVKMGWVEITPELDRWLASKRPLPVGDAEVLGAPVVTIQPRGAGAGSPPPAG